MTETTEPVLTRAFYSLCLAMAAKHGIPLKDRGLLTVGDENAGWHATLNTSKEMIDDLPPKSARLLFNGFPCGVFDSSGGIILADGEQAFIKWCESFGEPQL